MRFSIILLGIFENNFLERNNELDLPNLYIQKLEF